MIANKYVKFPVTFFGLIVLFWTTPAKCEDAAPRATKSDDRSSIINPNLGFFKFTNGEIKQSKLPVSIEAGRVSDDEGRIGTHLSVEAYKPLIIFGGEGTSAYRRESLHRGGLFSVQLGGKLSLDAAKKDGEKLQVVRSEITGPRVGIGTYQFSYEPEKSPTFTLRMDGPSAAYSKKESSPIAHSEKVADIELSKFGLHGAYKVNGVNIDHSFEAALVLKAGEIQIGQNQTAAMGGTRLSASTGVQLGSIGNLNDQIALSYIYTGSEDRVVGQNLKHEDIKASNIGARVVQFTNTVSLKDIANTPIAVSWVHQKELSDSGGKDSQNRVVNSNYFMAGAAF